MDPFQRTSWKYKDQIAAVQYTCGYCDCIVSSDVGLDNDIKERRVRICPNCDCATYIEEKEKKQIPGPSFGADIKNLDDTNVRSLYVEARQAFRVNSFTAAVLCCRKLLMNIAVSKGAPQGQSFTQYVEHLSANNYIPPSAKEWVDYIRQRGNEATHEIQLMTREDAELLIRFSEMLLRQVFEFPGIIKKLKGATPTP